MLLEGWREGGRGGRVGGRGEGGREKGRVVGRAGGEGGRLGGTEGEGGRGGMTYTYSNGTTIFKKQSRHVLRNNVSRYLRRTMVRNYVRRDVDSRSPSQINSQSWCTNKLCPFQYKLIRVYYQEV